MKHSPGPWTAYDNAAYGTAIKSGQINKYVANVHMYAGLSLETYQANARLIAAAPDLLEAARMMADLVDDLLVQAGANYADELAAARAAITKAEGGAA